MVGYIVLGVFILFAISCFFCFFLGWTKGREKEAKTNKELEKQREQTVNDFNKLSNELKQGAMNEAEIKKAKLSNGSTGRDNFNNINNSLQNNAEN